MLVFIDESGCSGFKLAYGSSDFFVVGMVIFKNGEDAAQTRATIETLRVLLRHKPEFKFSKCPDAMRDMFCQGVATCPFTVRAMVVHKEQVYSALLRDKATQFYSYFLQMLFKRNDSTLRDAQVTIDGREKREFRRTLNRYFRQQVGTNKVRAITFRDSKSDSLLQLADMCVGSIARSYSERDKSNRWLQMLRPRIQNIWEFK